MISRCVDHKYIRGYDEGSALKLPQGESIPLDPIIAMPRIEIFLKMIEYETKSHDESFCTAFFKKRVSES